MNKYILRVRRKRERESKRERERETEREKGREREREREGERGRGRKRRKEAGVCISAYVGCAWVGESLYKLYIPGSHTSTHNTAVPSHNVYMSHVCHTTAGSMHVHVLVYVHVHVCTCTHTAIK